MATVPETRGLVVLDPSIAPDQGGLVLAPRGQSLRGATLGLLDNGKAGADRFLQHLGAALRDRYGVATVLTAQKSDASTVARPDVLDPLVRRCHFIVAGVGD